MKIAVIDVAAERSGALSVLKDFHAYVYSNSPDHDWTFFTSVVDLAERDNIHLIKKPWIKKSWIHRIAWEFLFTWEINNIHNFDAVISLQNKSIRCKKICSIAYFHNMLLIQDKYKFSLFNKDERLYWVYKLLIAPLTLRSLRKADLIICQTQTAKERLSSRIKTNSIIAIPPQVELSVCGVNCKLNNCKSNEFFYPAIAHKFKNHEIIVKAVEYLVKFKGISDFSIYFTFNGDENEYAKKIYNMSKGLPQIKFIGYLSREELLGMYYSATLVITSKIESYPIPLVEAMCIEAPIVAIGYDYINEILKNYECKYISSTEDHKDFADLMMRSMDDLHCRNKLNGIQNINGNSIAQIVHEIEKKVKINHTLIN